MKFTGLKSESEVQAVEMAENLFKSSKFEQLAEVCSTHLDSFPENLSLWRLQGIAHGSLGNLQAARVSFLSALQLDLTDDVTIANYITSCLDGGDHKSALKAVEQLFDSLNYTGQTIVLESLRSAIKDGSIPKEDFPAVLKQLLGLNSETIAIVTVIHNGCEIRFKFVKQLTCGHGYELTAPGTDHPIAFIAGYRFSPGSPVIVEILEKESPVWEQWSLDFSKETSVIKQLILGLADGRGKFFGFKPPHLQGGYKLRGGF